MPNDYKRCRQYAVVVICDEDEDIDELYELATRLSQVVEHTPFETFVDDKYADPGAQGD